VIGSLPTSEHQEEYLGRNSVGDQPLTSPKKSASGISPLRISNFRTPFCIFFCPSPTPIEHIQRAHIPSYIGSSTELFLSTKFDALQQKLRALETAQLQSTGLPSLKGEASASQEQEMSELCIRRQLSVEK